MKTFIGLLLAVLPLSIFSQFPEPTNFNFSYVYFMIDDGGYCDGEMVIGPTYCSFFNWMPPDTSATSATFEHYKLYYFNYGTFDTLILAITSNTHFQMEIGILGEIWVTAVYSNPDGESEPSNIITNDDLPISVDEIKLQKPLTTFYDDILHEIIIRNAEDVQAINLYDSQGRMVLSEKSTNRLSIGNLENGLYVIEIILKDNQVLRQKIVK